MRYLFIEYRRAFFSYKFIIGVIGVTITHFLSIFKIAGINSSVYNTYITARYFIPFIVSMTFCTMCYAQSLCEDQEHFFLRQLNMRKSLRIYTISKIIVISMTAILAMVLGTMIFVLIVHVKVPWVLQGEILNTDILANFFQRTQFFPLYFVTDSLYTGMLAAMISVLAAYISLFWKNKLFVLSIPFMSFFLWNYFIKNLWNEISFLDFGLIFNPSLNLNNNEGVDLVKPIVIYFVVMGVLGLCVYRKLRRSKKDGEI